MKRLLLSVVLILNVAVAFADDTEGIENEVLFTRSPVTRQTLDSNIRLRSMGGLSLPIEDESNTIGAFKYVGSPAGLSQDYTRGKAELGIWGEGGKAKTKTSNGTSNQGDLYDSAMDSFDGMLAAHMSQSEQSSGSFAFGFTAESDEQEFEDASNPSLAPHKDEEALGRFYAGYGHQFGNFLAGLSIDRSKAKIDSSFTFTGIPSTLESEATISQIIADVGYKFHTSNEGSLIVTAGPRIQKQKTEVDSSGPITLTGDSELDGVGVGLGVVYNQPKLLSVGFSFNSNKMDGDSDLFTPGGKDEETNSDMSLRAYLRREGSPLSLGAEITSSNVKDKSEDNVGAVQADDETTETSLGLGVAFHFAEDRGLIGLELTSAKGEDEDKLDPTNVSGNEDRQRTQISLGGEMKFGQKFVGRAGLRFAKLSEDNLGSTPELDTGSAEIDLGGEYAFTERFSLSGMLSTIGISADGDASSSRDEVEYGASSLEMLARLRFGGEQL